MDIKRIKRGYKLNNLNIIPLDSVTSRVKLPSTRDSRTKEEIKQDQIERDIRIKSNITPFISNIQKLKESSGLVYLYLSFDELICCEDAQKCIKKISGEKNPKIKTVSEDEMSVILEVDPSNINVESFIYKNKLLSYFKALTSEPKIFAHDNFVQAYKEVSSKEINDNLEINNIVIVLNTDCEPVNKFEELKETGLFEELRLVKEVSILFGILKKSKEISNVREIPYVACAYLENLDDINVEYHETQGKTNIDVIINYVDSELISKPTVCIIDCGVTDSFKVLDEQKLEFIGDNLLDHGSQIASIAVGAKSLLSGDTNIKQEFNILSYKMCDGKKENIIEGLINAIKIYSHKCNLFVLSYNYYYTLPPILLHYLSKRIDSFIQKTNIIVLVSTGNNNDETIQDSIDFNYLDRNPILFPSNCKNVVSTGALLKYNSSDKSIAPYTRYLPFFPDLEHQNEAYFILKPNIYVYGGGKSLDNSSNFFLPTISADKKIVNFYGTSFANGLLAYYFLLLIKEYNQVKFAETYKALMLSSGYLEVLNNRDEGSIKISINSIQELESDIKHVLLFDEHEEDINFYRRDQTSQNSEELSFYVDSKKVSKIQIFLVHSNNYINNPYTNSLIYFNVRLYEPNAVKTLGGKYTNFGDRSKWSTFGKCTPVQIAEYKLGVREHKINSQTGDWKLQVMPMRKNIPTDIPVNVRWGVVIKLIPRREYLNKVDEIYDDVMEKTKGLVKEESIKIVESDHIEKSSSDEVTA